MKIIAFLKNKGGVGCTTNAYNLATYLAHQGRSVLMLDGDMQGDSTALMRVAAQPGMFNLLINGQEFDDVWVGVPGEQYGRAGGVLYVVPSDEPSGRAIAGMLASEYVVPQRLAELEGRFDVVIVDTSPSASELHAGIFLAADYVIYPTQCQAEPINAVKRSLTYYEKYRAETTASGRKVAELLGVMPTMFRGRELLQHQLYGWLTGKYGDAVFPFIRDYTAWQQAAAARQPIWLWDSRSKAAKDARAVYERIEAVL